MLTLVAAIVVVALAYYYYGKMSEGERDLPEPYGLPFLGQLFQMGLTPYLKMTEWAKIHGNMYRLKLGSSLQSVVLSDPALIREAFNNPAFTGRSDLKGISLLSDGKNGIALSDGQIWTEQRKFTLRHLRDFGFGKKSMENLIMDEVNETIEGFRKELYEPVSVQHKFSLAVLNSLWQIVSGKRYSHDDPKLNELMDTAFKTFGESTLNPIIIFFPKLAQFFPNASGWAKLVASCSTLREFFREQIVEHRKTIEKNNPRDFIDTYLEEMNKTTDEDSSFHKNNGDTQILAVIGDLFFAGSETTSSTLQWAVLYLSQDLHCQRKLRKEIHSVVGTSKTPSLEDKPNMPFTEALIMEVLRKSSIVPTGLMHTTTYNTEFQGYKIPKKYGIMPNLYKVHNDPLIWGDPEKFRPERFIDDKGVCVKKHDALMPFSVGKRVCIGETLARDTIFLFLTCLYQQFEICYFGNNASLVPQPGFILQPKPFTVIFSEIE